jgi:hypothetical protein
MGAAFLWQDCGMVLSLVGGQYLAAATSGFRAPFVIFSALFLAATVLTFVLPHGARTATPAAPTAPVEGGTR